MASNPSERLKRLQMEDLGTARREHISTADDQHHRRTRLQDIEAGRLANVPGSDAQRLAIENEALLTGWANVYKTIGDTEDLEHLDTLLDGQTHRLSLNATIREGRGQTHARTGKGDERHFGAASSIRASRSLGRGGGVIGTRGRGIRQGSLTSSTPNLGYRVVLPPTNPHPDPALDTSSDFYKRTRQGNASKKEEVYKVQNKQPSVRKPTPIIRARRPMVDYGRLISPPENFLAAARNVVSTNTAGVTPTGTAKASGDNRPNDSTKSVDTAGGSDHYSPLKVQEHPEFQIPARPQAATRSGDPPVLFPTCSTYSPHQNITKAGESLPISMSSTIRDTASQEEGSTSMSLESEQSAPGLIEIHSQEKEQATPGMSTPITNGKSSLEEYHATGAEDSGPMATTNATDALLLDLSSTPPEQRLLGQSPLATAMMSPTLEDLQGLEFEDLDLLQDPVFHDPAPRIQPIGSRSAFNLQRQIDILCELLESTSLSDVSRENLKQCKDELEGKMNKHSPTDETKGEGVLSPGEHLSQNVEAVTEPGGQSQWSLDLLDMQDTPTESVRLNITQSPSPQSRLNVTAPPFFPHMPYRSPANSISRPSEPRVKFTIPQQYSLTLAPKPPVMEAFRPDDAGENIQPLANPSPELQLSMHAPKPKPRHKTTALGGLESSWYANPSSSKPLR